MLESLFIILKYLFLNFSREIMLSKAINVPQSHLNRSPNFHYRSNYQSHFHDRSKHSLHVLRMKRLEQLHSAVKKLLCIMITIGCCERQRLFVETKNKEDSQNTINVNFYAIILHECGHVQVRSYGSSGKDWSYSFDISLIF